MPRAKVERRLALPTALAHMRELPKQTRLATSPAAACTSTRGAAPRRSRARSSPRSRATGSPEPGYSGAPYRAVGVLPDSHRAPFGGLGIEDQQPAVE